MSAVIYVTEGAFPGRVAGRARGSGVKGNREPPAVAAADAGHLAIPPSGGAHK